MLIKKQRQKEKANWSHLWPPFPSLLFIVLLVCFAACGVVKMQLIALNVLRGKVARAQQGHVDGIWKTIHARRKEKRQRGGNRMRKGK